jgi:hypothetical protein
MEILLQGFAAVVGDVLDGYTVLAIDEDKGVKLRNAAGGEVDLLPPR